MALEFHRHSDFETPLAIFILQVERYIVTTGTVVRAIEQAEAINNTFVDYALKYLIRLISNRHRLCRRGRQRGRCAVFLRNDCSSGEHGQYENKDACFQMPGDTLQPYAWMLCPNAC